jgi:hypothetical protein
MLLFLFKGPLFFYTSFKGIITGCVGKLMCLKNIEASQIMKATQKSFGYMA